MQTYHVTWNIDVDAENPEEAARKAWEIMRRLGSSPNVFFAIDEAGEATRVDLEELDRNV